MSTLSSLPNLAIRHAIQHVTRNSEILYLVLIFRCDVFIFGPHDDKVNKMVPVRAVRQEVPDNSVWNN